MESRREPRIGRSSPVSFTTERLVGKGRLVNLSSKGCCFTSIVALEKGEALTVRLHAPGEGPPIEVDRAVVRWISSDQVGIQFLDTREPELTRLTALLE